ncbi:hypothetical protein H9W95_01340 [Flavobacterium lindanitolerans]|nr:hypothetical protein [Flavobacterium lindanitolerans]
MAAQEETGPSNIDPLKVPTVSTQLALGVSCVAAAQLSFAGFGKERTQILKANVVS